jgi:hypothetical protein
VIRDDVLRNKANKSFNFSTGLLVLVKTKPPGYFNDGCGLRLLITCINLIAPVYVRCCYLYRNREWLGYSVLY